MEDLGKIVEDPTPPPAAPPATPPAAPSPAPDPAPDPVPEPPKAEDKKPVTDPPPAVVTKKLPDTLRREVEDNVRREVERALANRNGGGAPQPAPPVAAPTPSPSADIEESLGDVEREELALWRFAEKSMPEKYKGSADKYLKSLKEVEDYISKAKIGEDGEERSLDENDEGLQKFIRGVVPEFQGADRRRLERKMIMEEVEQTTSKKLEERQKELEKKQRALDRRPDIERGVSKFEVEVRGLLKTPTEGQPEDVNEVVASVMSKSEEEGWEKAVKEDPFHGPIVKSVMDKAVRRASQYLALVNEATDYRQLNPELPLEDPKNDHAWIANFIRRQGEYLSSSGGDERYRQTESGKVEFIPVHEFVPLYQKDPTATVQRYWTFQPQDVLNMLADYARREATAEVQREMTRATAAGYQRQKKEPPKPPEKKEKPANREDKTPPSPKTPASLSPGVAAPVPPVTERVMSEAEFKALGIPAPK